MTDELDAALDDARRGGEWGTTLLYRTLNPPLLRYLRHCVHGVAEDLASESWVAAVRGLATFRGDASDFRAWLFTVARRRVVDHYRQQGRRPRFVSLENGVEIATLDDPADAATTRISAQQAIALLTRELSPDQAEAVLLRVVGDLSIEQVARIMGRSPGSVRVLQHRALRRLEKILTEL